MRLVRTDFSPLARLEIAPLEITLSSEEILADLLYPEAAELSDARS